MIWLAFFSGSLFGATIVGWAARKQIRETQAEALRLISARGGLMRMDRLSSPLAAVGAATERVLTAPACGLGGSPVGTFSIPFLPFDIEAFLTGTQNQSGQPLHADQSTRGASACPTRDVSKPTQSVAEAS
jgi:hypothetical protein